MESKYNLWRASVYVALLACFCFPVQQAKALNGSESDDIVRKLSTAYPDIDFRSEYEGGFIYIYIDAEKYLFSPPEGCPKANPEAPSDQPLCSMFEQKYPAGTSGRFPAKNFDPGRVRNERFMQQLYGQNEASVREHCIAIQFLGQKIVFNKKTWRSRSTKKS